MEITPLIVLVPVVIGVVQAIKTGLKLPVRYAPLLSIVLGVSGAFLIGGTTPGVTILAGVVTGLVACGLYSGVKTTVTA